MDSREQPGSRVGGPASPGQPENQHHGDPNPDGSSDELLEELATALSEVRRGRFDVRLATRSGLPGRVVDGFNGVVSLQQRRNRELLRISRVVGQEGRILERVDEEAFDGEWATGVAAVNSLVNDLARPVAEIARVIEAVADGDLTQHIALAIEGRPLRGEFHRIGYTVNTMVDQLSAFADEVTRVAGEVGTEGKLGGQAAVPRVSGTWRDLTDNVNYMASNLTDQVRNIAQVATAVAQGDLSQKITVDARGEILELKNTVNTMVDQLSAFADEVTRVAREVGTEGKLGGQAAVPHVSGTWRDLTDNVNQLASTLTIQLRAIAGVSTAVTRGDLSQQIGVRASGEVADLKNNINQMIVTLRETTRKNAEQNWLDSNLVRLGGLLQGKRDLGEVCQMIMDEITPLVHAQGGAFFVAHGGDGDSGNPSQWRLESGYGLETGPEPVSFATGEGLVGQVGASRKMILVRQLPPGYRRIRSGLGAADPAAVVLLPILFEGEALGVVEFASVTDFSELHLQFLQRLVTTIGVALKTIQANQRTEELLEQSQRLALELQDQSAELQRTNAELEEQAEQLSAQNRKIEIKNREIETARRGVEDKARQLASASQYKSEFLANMSHELRTPLNSLLLLSRLLAENTDHNLSPRQIEFAHTIHSAGTDLLALIDDILDLSKIEAGRVDVELGEVRLAEIRTYVEQAFRPQAEQKGLDLTVDLAPELAPAVAPELAPAVASELAGDSHSGSTMVTDPHRLRQILRNLLSNAVKFTHHGGVTLTITPAPAGTHYGVPSLDSADQVISFTVSDTGIGIAAEKLAMIFEAFQQADGTTSRQYGGTGLGLSISRELARLLGGSITVTSAPGSGSTFTLYLPRRGTNTVTTTLPAGSTPPGGVAVAEPGIPILRPASVSLASDRHQLDAVTVLIVDDDIRNVFALTSALELHRLTVLYADNGEDGLRLLTEHPEVDIVLMDAMMPNLDGDETTRLIRRLPTGAGLPVVFLTAKAMPGDREASLAAGADDYITKPVDLDELLELIASWVSRRGQAGR